jgi:hypothetical protein
VRTVFLIGCLLLGCVWYFGSLEKLNTWLAAHAALLTVFGSLIALLNYQNSIRVARRNARRASVELAARECGKFGMETLPQFAEIRAKFESAGCEYLKHLKAVNSKTRLEPDEHLARAEDRAQFEKESAAITKAVNAVESFAIPFLERVADEEVGFRECGPAFVRLFEDYFGLFCHSDFERIFPATQPLYWRWRRRKEWVESMDAFWRTLTPDNQKNTGPALMAACAAWWEMHKEYRKSEIRRALWRPVTEQTRR